MKIKGSTPKLPEKQSIGLRILEQIVTSGEGRSVRLLREPNSSESDGWFMFLPPSFNEALDICLTPRQIPKVPRMDPAEDDLHEEVLSPSMPDKGNKVTVQIWTQGGSFSFKTGDTIYTRPTAYEAWEGVLSGLEFGVQVRHARPASNQANAERVLGLVVFDILTPAPVSRKMIITGRREVTQDDFVRFLISGRLPQQTDL